MNEERPIQLLPTRWDRGLLAMVGWSLALHVAAAGGVLTVLPWARARPSRPIPSYTVELTSLAPGSARAVGGLPGKKPKSDRVSPSSGKLGKTPVKSKEAPPAAEPPKAPPKRAKDTPEDTEKATKAKKPETTKKSEEVQKKPPSANKAESAKSKEPAKKVVKSTKTVAVKKVEPKKVEPKKIDRKKPATVATGKEGSKTKPAPKSDAAKGTKKARASAKPSAASKPTVKKESAGRGKKAEGATEPVPKDGAGREPEGGGDLVNDPQYAAAIESIRRRVEQGGSGLGGGGQVAATGAGSGVGGGDRVVGTEFLIYYNIMIAHIKQAWVWVGHDQSLSVTVRFAIEPDGEIRNVKIDRSSGDPSYDQSVLGAVRRVNPLPPPPAAYSRDFRQVELTFRPGDLREAG